MKPRAMVPGRLQAAAELGYETIMAMCLETIGPEGRKFFPLIFTLFFFILFGNLLGVFPYFFTFTSHIAVTLGLSLFVFVLVTVVALRDPRAALLQLLRAPGRPRVADPRAGADRAHLLPLAHHFAVGPPVRQHDGRSRHARGVRRLRRHARHRRAAGGIHTLSFLPAILAFAVNTALIGFEVLVAALQAYVFALLTCIYLHDAVHLH